MPIAYNGMTVTATYGTEITVTAELAQSVRPGSVKATYTNAEGTRTMGRHAIAAIKADPKYAEADKLRVDVKGTVT